MTFDFFAEGERYLYRVPPGDMFDAAVKFLATGSVVPCRVSAGRHSRRGPPRMAIIPN